jgi:hypothetical protein
MFNTRMKKPGSQLMRSDDFGRSDWSRRSTVPRSRRMTKPRVAPRMLLIQSIRSQIAAGTYDTPDRLDAALDRLLDTHQLDV